MLAVGPASAKLLIDYFDFRNWNKDEREVRMFVDILDSTGRVVPPEKIPWDDIKLFVEDKEVPITVTKLETVKEANEPLAVGIVIAAHNAYAYVEEGSGAPNILNGERDGYKRFLDELSDQDYTGIWYYNEEGLSAIRAWQQSPASAKGLIDDRIKDATEKKEGQSPRMFLHLKRVFEDIKENEGSFEGVRRKIVVLMSDGVHSQRKQNRIDAQIDEIATLAEDTKTKLYVIGYTIGPTDNLVHLDTLASKTNGIYRQLKTEDEDTIAAELEKLGRELKKQYVISFTTGEFDGSAKPVNVRLELKADGKLEKQNATVEEWIEIPFDWMVIVKWAGIVLGSLLGIFLLIKLFGALARRKSNRPTEVEEEEEFAGPYKGKLTCSAGAYAGAEFFLTEDVTTIGAIQGNTIVIQDAGISKRHAGIKIEDMRFELADFGSTNGTYVNGSKITKQFLRDGDKLKIGECELKFTLK